MIARGRRYFLVLGVVAGFTYGCGSGDAVDDSTPKDAVVPQDETPPPGAPVITSFKAEADKLTIGKSTKLTAVFTGGTATIDNGIGKVTSGTAVPTANLTKNTKFTLTVRAENGTESKRSIDIAAFAAPTITSFTIEKPTISSGKVAKLKGEFTGTGAVDNGVGAIASGVTKDSDVLSNDTTFTLTATNEAGDAVTSTAKATVVAAPTIASFVAADPKVSRYVGGTTLTATFAGGTGTIDQGIGAVTTSVGTATGIIGATSKTYTLTVTNAAEDSETRTVTVDVKKEIFATTPSSVIVFDEDATGDVAPKRRIAGANTAFSTAIGLSSYGSELFVMDFGGAAIRVFDVTDDGNVAPKRTVNGAAFGANDALGIFASPTELFVGNYNSSTLKVFNVTDTGAVAAKRQLSGGTSTISGPCIPWVDNGELYVPNYSGGRVTVFNETDTGNVAPKRAFNVGGVVGVAVQGNELIASGTQAITVLDKATGTQLRQITGGTTSFNFLYQCVPSATEIFCVDRDGGGIKVFPLDGNGDIAPTRTISGGTSTVSQPGGIVVK